MSKPCRCWQDTYALGHEGHCCFLRDAASPLSGEEKWKPLDEVCHAPNQLLKIGSLFTGYAGLDLAVAEVFGATTAWVSDIDKGACKFLDYRFPDAPNLGDITQIDWADVEPVDILTGGFPCQDLSLAGARAGLADGTRSGLWSHMCEAIEKLRPRLVAIENVRGLLSAEALRPVEPCPWCLGGDSAVDLRALGAVLADLASVGYDCRWTSIRASDAGAPHGRFRVFLIAYPQGNPWRIDDGKPGEATAHATVRRRNESEPATARERHEQAGRCDSGPRDALTLLPTPTASDPGSASSHASEGFTPPLGEVVRLLPTPLVGSTSPAAHGQISGDFRARMDEAFANFGQYSAAIARWESIIGRPAPSPTEPTGKGGAHRLSARFTEWMMGLPDGWITGVPGATRTEALRLAGNGVVPQQAAAALTNLLAMEAVA